MEENPKDENERDGDEVILTDFNLILNYLCVF